MTVKTYYSYKNLPPKVKEIEYPPFQDTHDYNNYMVIEWGDGSIQVERDGGEPEDQLFGRDWKWVLPAIQKAFEEGKSTTKGVE